MSKMSKIDHDLVEAVKRYPQIYMNGCDLRLSVWDDVATQINLSTVYCKSRWLSLQYNYAKIRNIIKDYWILESELQDHPCSSQYLDGSLKFLDPFLCKLPDTQIPAFVHQRYQWVEDHIGNSNLVTQKMVQSSLIKRNAEAQISDNDMKYLMEAVENAINQCIAVIKNNKEDRHIDNVSERGIAADINLDEENENNISNSKENEDIKEYDPLNFEGVDDQKYDVHNIMEDDDHVNSAYAMDDDIISSRISPEIDVKEEALDNNIEPLNTSEVAADRAENIVEHSDIKEFFNHLADVVSSRLPVEKHRELQQRVSDLVYGMLESNTFH